MTLFDKETDELVAELEKVARVDRPFGPLRGAAVDMLRDFLVKLCRQAWSDAQQAAPPPAADPATLRHHADQLAAALEYARSLMDRPCDNPECDAVFCQTQRARLERIDKPLRAWREGPGAERKGGEDR